MKRKLPSTISDGRSEPGNGKKLGIAESDSPRTALCTPDRKELQLPVLAVLPELAVRAGFRPGTTKFSFSLPSSDRLDDEARRKMDEPLRRILAGRECSLVRPELNRRRCLPSGWGAGNTSGEEAGLGVAVVSRNSTWASCELSDEPRAVWSVRRKRAPTELIQLRFDLPGAAWRGWGVLSRVVSAGVTGPWRPRRREVRRRSEATMEVRDRLVSRLAWSGRMSKSGWVAMVLSSLE